MLKNSKVLRSLSAALVLAGIEAAPCGAIDFQPFDYVPAPPETNMLMGYYEYGTRDEVNNTITGTTSRDTNVDSHIGILRYLHYNEIFDRPYLLQVLLPFGGFHNDKIDGTRLSEEGGMGDPIISAVFWPLADKENRRYFSISDYLSLPLGTYDERRALNLGANRWQNDVQVDFNQGFLGKFTFDIAGDWIYYGDNKDADPEHAKLTENSSYNVYGWLSYDVSEAVQRVMPSASNASISVGYAGTYGGKQRLNGVYDGSETVEHQIRLTYMQMFAPTWQGLVSLNHDTGVSGEFKQEFGIILRVTKIF